MANPLMDQFKKNFLNATGVTTDEFQKALDMQKKITATSGNNVRFDNSSVEYQYIDPETNKNAYTNNMSKLGSEYADAINKIVKFYQTEFGMTPRATLGGDLSVVGGPIAGRAYSAPDKTGQYEVELDVADDYNADQLKYSNSRQESHGWWPKGSGGNLEATPVHELGHVVTFQLFPSGQKTDSLLEDSFKDMGINYKSSEGRMKAINEAEKISGYGGEVYRDPYDSESQLPVLNSYETIAEALTDYYYNRDNAADLSKAIVKRLKRSSSMYGITQAGGVGGKGETFLQNLRRYNVIH